MSSILSRYALLIVLTGAVFHSVPVTAQYVRGTRGAFTVRAAGQEAYRASCPAAEDGVGYALVITDSAKAATGSLLAIVTDSASRPVVDAEVSVSILRSSRLTGPDGRACITDIPLGTHDITVRRLGYGVSRGTIAFSARSTAERHFVLAHVVTLDSVKTVARRGPGTGFEAFDERRKLGFGRFFDSAEIRTNEERRLSDLLRGIPSVAIDLAPECRRKGCGTMVAYSTRGRCVMAVKLDNVLISKQNPPAGYGFDLRSISLSSIEAIEVYRGNAEIPSEFTGMDLDCGMLVLWTRRHHDDKAP